MYLKLRFEYICMLYYNHQTQFGDYNYQNSMQHQSQPDFYQNNNNQSNNNMPYNQGKSCVV